MEYHYVVHPARLTHPPLAARRPPDPAGRPVPAGGRVVHIGTSYSYFSTKALTDQERFTLALKWPLRDMALLRFSRSGWPGCAGQQPKTRGALQHRQSHVLADSLLKKAAAPLGLRLFV